MTRPRRLRSALAPLALAGVVATSACSSNTVTRTALQDAVGPTFHRLYSLQQSELGHSSAAPTPDSTASCIRAGTSATTGSGSWSCTVHYPFPDGHIEPVSFDVEVQPIGCYTATGPATVVGGQHLRTSRGQHVTNPLFAFDGCFALS